MHSEIAEICFLLGHLRPPMGALPLYLDWGRPPKPPITNVEPLPSEVLDPALEFDPMSSWPMNAVIGDQFVDLNHYLLLEMNYMYFGMMAFNLYAYSAAFIWQS